ncbi:MAG: hypothetical protein HOW73_21355 [Polyangiaceae bacterium]|nr:hypothetical protein [Polyangiaceae bacterium]
MRAFIYLIAFSASVMLLTVLAPGEAQAAVVQVKVKAEVSAPYLVVKPPRPIIRPRRITMYLDRPGVETHVRLFGHHHHHHVVRVGYYAPVYHIHTSLPEHHIHVGGPDVIVDRPHVVVDRPHVHVHEPKVKVHVHAPEIHVGGPSVHVGGHHHVGGHVHGPGIGLPKPHLPKPRVGGSVRVKAKARF